MGTFHHQVEVSGMDGQRFETLEALVDTGSTYTVIPASLLRGLGIAPQERIEFELADGRIIERDIGEARIRVDGRNATTLVVFGDEGVSSLLGAYTLEGVRLAVDPVNQRLIPTRALLMRANNLATVLRKSRAQRLLPQERLQTGLQQVAISEGHVIHLPGRRLHWRVDGNPGLSPIVEPTDLNSDAVDN